MGLSGVVGLAGWVLVVECVRRGGGGSGLMVVKVWVVVCGLWCVGVVPVG